MNEQKVLLHPKVEGKTYEDRYDLVNAEVWLDSQPIGRVMAFEDDRVKRCLTHLIIESNNRKVHSQFKDSKETALVSVIRGSKRNANSYRIRLTFDRKDMDYRKILLSE